MPSDDGLLPEIATLRQRLEASERQFRAVFDSALDAMVVLDDEGRYLDVNAAACALYGRRREEMLGARVGDFSAPSPSRDTWSTQAGTGRGDWHIVRPDGTRREVEFAAADFETGRRFAVIRDVTERRRAEETLRAREERFRALVENSSDAVLLVAADGTVIFHSEAARRILGYESGERLGRSAFEIVHPDDLPRVRRVFGEALARPGVPFTTGFRVARKEGGWRSVEGVATNHLEAPAIGAVVVNYRDVTDRNQAEEQLRGSEARLRAVLDAALDGVIGMNAGDVITYWNPRAEVIFGWKREEALGQILRDLIIPERYREAHRRGMAHFLATGQGPILDRRIELQGLRRGGTEFPVELSITALEEGDSFSFSAFVADITDRQRAEVELRRYADVFRNMQVGVNVWCLQDRSDLRSFKLISTNPAAVHSLGLRTEDILGKRMGEAFPFMLNTDLPRLYREVVVSGEGRDLGEVRALYGGDGASPAVFAAKVFPLPGDCVGVAFENITERRRLEDQLRQSQRLEAVGSLAGGIAHDFNNLLSVILGQCELMGRGLAESDPTLHRVAEIRKAGQRAALLTNQLLAFSRKQVLIPEILEPGSVVSDLASMLRRLIGEDIVLQTVIEATGAVKADRGQVEQVITNLVVNARDAMPEGGTITVEVADADIDATWAARHPPTAPGRYIRLAVRDTGEGMDAATRGRVFEPFFTTKEKGKGTGLGLATVYGIVKQSGGYVWLESEPGKGATFEIFLPRLDGVTAATAAPADPVAPPSGTETILLIEDEDMLRELAGEILREAGYHVLEARGGEEAVRLAASHTATIHLLLTDVVMPGISGRVAAERIGAARPAMKVLFTSGYTDDAVLQRGVQTEQAAFLAKPYTTEGLARKVREVLDSGARPGYRSTE